MAFSNLFTALSVVTTTAVAYFALLTYRHRSRINALRNQGFPMPAGWSWLFGHSLVILRYTKCLPYNANVVLAMKDMSEDFKDTEMFLIDLWPGYPTSIIVFNPEACNSVSQKLNLPRPKQPGEAIKPIVGGTGLVAMNGSQWKTWRSLFNPGFSATNISNHVPFMVDCAQIFCEKLRKKAGRGIVSLDEYATQLTFDVIMKVTLDTDVKSQLDSHPLPTAFETITNWHSFWDVRVLWNPLRPFVQKYNGDIINNYVRKELETRFAEMKKHRSVVGNSARSVISLALESYFHEKTSNIASEPQFLDESFVKTVTNQIRFFLFAGNDTTSSTIAFTFHMISQHPDVLARMRQEHDTVFGQDLSTTVLQLKEQPALLHKCTYTQACIKETLRLYPPAANMRQGQPGVSLTALNGQLLPTNGFNIIIVQQTVHQNPRVWIRPKDFIPERWLVGPDHELYPPQNAYRPFDIGPRACIGVSMVMAEIKIVMIMAARTVTVTPAYDEWDYLQAEKGGIWKKIVDSIGTEVINTVHGDRVYQSEKAGTHPADGYPCRIALA